MSEKTIDALLNHLLTKEKAHHDRRAALLAKAQRYVDDGKGAKRVWRAATEELRLEKATQHMRGVIIRWLEKPT